MKKSSTFFLKLIVGLSLIFFIFSRIEWNEFINTIKRINLVYIYISMILFFFPGVWLSVCKWKKLMLVHNINLPFKQLYLYYLIGIFFNNFLPSTVGGDVSRVVYLKHATNKTAEITASIIMERLTGLVALIFLFLFSAIFDISIIFGHPIVLYIIILIFLSITAIYLLLRNDVLEKHVCKFRFLIPLWEKVNEIFELVCNYWNYKKVLLYTIIISIIFVMFGALATYLFFLSIGIKAPIFDLILIYSAVQLIGMLPISINSLGLSEGASIILYGLIGISSVDALTVALMARFSLMLVSLSGGVIFIFRNIFIEQS
ncbi:MAG: lysylphosphatidylglycerol synthase transmembrane domain-containing protein [Candidatus Methanoperedens sp.]|nr:lysylphosphatidylglycerol synthase transmembrane domain-containing protein [Candidatus Methanoperedens sp.]